MAPALSATQHVIRAVAIWQRVFVANAGAVADLPVLVTELRIDQRAGKGFGLVGDAGTGQDELEVFVARYRYA